MASAANFQTNQSLPFYPSGNVTGAVLTLTQARAHVAGARRAERVGGCSRSAAAAAVTRPPPTDRANGRTRATTRSVETCAARRTRARSCAPIGRAHTP